MSALNHTIKYPSKWRSSRPRRRMRMPSNVRAWSVWMVSAVFVLFQFFLQLTSGEIVSGLMRSFDLSALGAGALTSSYYFIYVLLQSPAGLLVDRYGPRLLLSLGAVVVTIGCLGFSVCTHVVAAICYRLMMGAGAAFAFVGCLSLINTWFAPSRFATMTSIAEMFGMFGSIGGGLMLAKLICSYGWRQCMWGASLVCALLAIALWVIIRDAPPDRLQQRQASARNVKQLWPDIKKLLAKPVAWFNALYSGLTFGVITVFVSMWGVPFLQNTHHVSLLDATSICDSAFVGVALGCPLIGFLDSRYRCRRWIMVIAPWVGALLLSVILAVGSLSTDSLYVLMFFLGICLSTYMLTFVIANQIATRATLSTSVGFVNTFSVGTAPLLQPLVGFILDRHSHHHAVAGVLHYSLGQYQWALAVMVVSLIMAGWLALRLPVRQS